MYKRQPYSYKSDRKTSKKILRKLHRDIYPEEFSKLKKKGFTIPLDTWLGDENLKIMKAYLMRSDAFASTLIEHDYIEYLFNAVGNIQFEDYISRPSAYQRILVLYSLELWHENYLKP